MKKFLGKVTFVRGYVVWNCLSHSLPLLYKCVLSSKLSVLVGHWLYSRRSQHSWWRTAFLHNFDLTSLNANLALSLLGLSSVACADRFQDICEVPVNGVRTSQEVGHERSKLTCHSSLQVTLDRGCHLKSP